MILDLEQRSWATVPASDLSTRASAAIEQGAVLYLPTLPFEIRSGEQRLFSIGPGRGAKNISFTPASNRLSNVDAHGEDAAVLSGALARFSGSAASLVRALFPAYAGRLEVARASFRPAEIAGRQISWRKDDTRLHVDSFPSSPTGGKRILRVFTNVNPHGRPRIWRVGGSFVDIVARYREALRIPWAGQAALLRALRVTRARRTAYDALMLQLHDCMKRDDEFQSAEGQTTVEFAAGSTWLAFTDEVAHAAMAGQYQFEQTILVPVAAMIEEARSPLRVLERAMGQPLT